MTATPYPAYRNIRGQNYWSNPPMRCTLRAEARLMREARLDFLLRPPKHPFTSSQLATLAWQNSRLSDAQVRTYIMRLRNRLREVGLEHVITVVRNRGYGVTATLGKVEA